MTRCMFATVSLLPGVLRFVVNDLFAVDCFTCKRKATQRPPRKPPPRPRPEKQTGSESNSHRASNQSSLTPFIYFNSCFSKLVRAWLLKLNTKARGRPLRLAFLIAAPGALASAPSWPTAACWRCPTTRRNQRSRAESACPHRRTGAGSAAPIFRHGLH